METCGFFQPRIVDRSSNYCIVEKFGKVFDWGTESPNLKLAKLKNMAFLPKSPNLMPTNFSHYIRYVCQCLYHALFSSLTVLLPLIPSLVSSLHSRPPSPHLLPPLVASLPSSLPPSPHPHPFPQLPIPSLLSSPPHPQLCSSYPEESIVPLSSKDNDIRKVAAFRHLGRFPVLAFHHKKNQVELTFGFSEYLRLLWWSCPPGSFGSLWPASVWGWSEEVQGGHPDA